MEFGNNQPPKKPDETVIDMNEYFKNMPSSKNMFKALLGIIILGIIVFGSRGAFYKVGTDETAIILRLGKFSTLSGPGLHFKIPFGIDRVIFVKTGKVLKEEFGFRTSKAGIRSVYQKKGYDDEALMLSGDLNVIDLEWIVQFQVSDPFKFIFNIKNPLTTIRDLSEATVRGVVGDSHVTDILTTERSALADKVHTNLQRILDRYNIGVRIITVKFQDVNPPEKVKGAFNEVNEAEQQKESLILQAKGQYNKEVPKAKGEAKQVIQESEGYAMERINRALGETSRFLALMKQYKQYPEVTRQRLYLETLDKVLPKLKETYILDQNKGSNSVIPLLPLKDTDSLGIGGK